MSDNGANFSEPEVGDALASRTLDEINEHQAHHCIKIANLEQRVHMLLRLVDVYAFALQQGGLLGDDVMAEYNLSYTPVDGVDN